MQPLCKVGTFYLEVCWLRALGIKIYSPSCKSEATLVYSECPCYEDFQIPAKMVWPSTVSLLELCVGRQLAVSLVEHFWSYVRALQMRWTLHGD